MGSAMCSIPVTGMIDSELTTIDQSNISQSHLWDGQVQLTVARSVEYNAGKGGATATDATAAGLARPPVGNKRERRRSWLATQLDRFGQLAGQLGGQTIGDGQTDSQERIKSSASLQGPLSISSSNQLSGSPVASKTERRRSLLASVLDPAPTGSSLGRRSAPLTAAYGTVERDVMIHSSAAIGRIALPGRTIAALNAATLITGVILPERPVGKIVKSMHNWLLIN